MPHEGLKTHSRTNAPEPGAKPPLPLANVRILDLSNVLAGPLGSTLDIWQPHVEAFAEQFQVLRYDHRGHGRSPVPNGFYAIQDLALDVLALLDRLSIERAAFCGLSLGGMVGISLAAREAQGAAAGAPAPAPSQEVQLVYRRITWTWAEGGVTATDDWAASVT